MTNFTTLERYALAAMSQDNPEVATPLTHLISGAHATERENTGHGFYTSFQVDRSQAPLPMQKGPLVGPNLDVQVGQEVLMMGFYLWFEGGHPACLEGFQYATRAGEHIDLKLENLSALIPLGRMDEAR